jgi:hypothetical protein
VIKAQLSELCNVQQTHIDNLVRDKTLPPSVCLRGGSGIDFAPIAVLVVELVLALEKVCGPSASLPKKFARFIYPRLEAVWHDPTRRGPITAEFEGATITVPYAFIERARMLASAAPR